MNSSVSKPKQKIDNKGYYKSNLKDRQTGEEMTWETQICSRKTYPLLDTLEDTGDSIVFSGLLLGATFPEQTNLHEHQAGTNTAFMNTTHQFEIFNFDSTRQRTYSGSGQIRPSLGHHTNSIRQRASLQWQPLQQSLNSKFPEAKRE